MRLLLVLVLLLVSAFSVPAQVTKPELPQAVPNTRPSLLNDVGIDQKLNQQVPLDLKFRDETGQEVALQSYFGKKPVVLALIYYNCPMLCTLVLNGLIHSLNTMSFVVGKEFDVVVVSFDSRETAELASAKKRAYLERYITKGTEAGWHFLTGDEGSIKTLTQTVGFRYTYDPEKDLFAHASGVIVLTPEGKISKYFYGVEYSPRDLRLGLVEASENKIGSPVDQLLLMCYHYDPTTGKYGAVVMNVVRIAGSITLIIIISFIVFMVRKDRKKRQIPVNNQS
ncbi:MAG: SCO family protein [Acidobacteria bacterium]|nr:SCO family protein [Acidobacteriota bacterium]